ncbi:MAG: hypothetical protein HW387_891 [Parachlamydiales bacterium]|nr:hypothetical protein [Parachlamydiales bacterium]
MRKTFWVIVLLFVYIWVVSTGHEQFVLDQSHRLYQTFAAWFDDADVDLQIQRKAAPVIKKRPRRWD